MSSFLLSDIVLHTTVMRGISTAGHKVIGTVRRILVGLCFEVDAGPGTQRSLLWRELEVISGATPHPLIEDRPPFIEIVNGIATVLPPPPSLRRCDSGADYGLDGFPDVEFWHRQGIEADFLATEHRYRPDQFPLSPSDMRDRLLEVNPRAVTKGGLFLEAWTRQMKRIEQMLFIPRVNK